MRISESSNKVLVAAIFALSVAASPRSAEASGMTSSIEFSTSGTIGSTGMVGPQVVSFLDTVNGTMSTVGLSSPLEQFVVQPEPAGQTTTYNQTPFDIVLSIKSVDGSPTTTLAPIEIKGWLNGRLSGDRFSHLSYAINQSNGFPGSDASAPLYPAIVAPFQVGHALFHLNIPDVFNGGLLTGPGVAVTDVTGVLYTEAVPEPTILAMFATSIGLLLLNRSRLILSKRRNATSA